MARTNIDNGNSGLVARNAINDNFTELYGLTNTLSSPAYATPLATNAAAVGAAAAVAMTLTGALTLNVPTGTPKVGQRISYLLTASGGARVLTLNAALKVPTSVTFSGSIASGNIRLLTIAWTGAIWLVVENLEFTP